MTRLASLLIAAMIAALLAAPAAHAMPVIGIGEQTAEIFTDPHWTALGVKDVRVVVAWDALHYDWQRRELDDYMAAAHASGARVLLAFGHSRQEYRHRILPSPRRFKREFLAFRARYPWVREYLTWNEANHCSQPTCRRPEMAAAYFDVIRTHCPRCTIVAADVLDTSKMPAWVRRFRRATKATRRLIWGLHNYIDANRFYTRGTRSLLAAVKGDVWFTETGGLVARHNGSRIEFPGSIAHAANATRWVFKLAALSPRVRRIYFYHWAPAAGVDPTWDSALVDRHDHPRPAYDVLRRWLEHHRSPA